MELVHHYPIRNRNMTPYSTQGIDQAFQSPLPTVPEFGITTNLALCRCAAEQRPPACLSKDSQAHLDSASESLGLE